MTTSTPVSVSTEAAPSLWSNCKDLFNMIAVGVSTATTAITAVDDLVVAAQAQTSLIKDTSVHDADMKRLDLLDRMAARQAKRIVTSKSKSSKK